MFLFHSLLLIFLNLFTISRLKWSSAVAVVFYCLFTIDYMCLKDSVISYGWWSGMQTYLPLLFPSLSPIDTVITCVSLKVLSFGPVADPVPECAGSWLGRRAGCQRAFDQMLLGPIVGRFDITWAAHGERSRLQQLREDNPCVCFLLSSKATLGCWRLCRQALDHTPGSVILVDKAGQW